MDGVIHFGEGALVVEDAAKVREVEVALTGQTHLVGLRSGLNVTYCGVKLLRDISRRFFLVAADGQPLCPALDLIEKLGDKTPEICPACFFEYLIKGSKP